MSDPIQPTELVEEPASVSPDYFDAPKQGKGTRRLNRVPLIIGISVVICFMSFIAYEYFDRLADSNREQARAKAATYKVSSVAQPPVRRAAGPDVILPAGAPVEVSESKVASGGMAQGTSEAERQARARKAAELDAAMKAEAEISKFSLKQNQRTGSAPVRGPYGAPGMPGVDGLIPPPPPQYQYDQDGMKIGGDPNQQDEKRAFLNRKDEYTSPYLKHTREAALSATELKAGFIIPGVMLSGVNSDLPGQIIGQVRQNVYDSASGRVLLIPAGARLVGTYDSSVSAGQERVLVAWNRVIFPDSSSLSLDSMPGADKSGFAGFNEKVDNHYLRTFGNAFLLSLFSAGIQLSQPRAAVTGTYNSQQIMAAALGQQLGMLGMQTARRNLNLQPTLEISPGYQFSIMVTKDIILPPWRGHPLAQADVSYGGTEDEVN